MEFPDGLLAFKRTPDFEENTLPNGLRSRHFISPGVWGKIHVMEGKLKYSILEPLDQEMVLNSSVIGVVLPEVPHQVEPLGQTRFYVEFFRKE